MKYDISEQYADDIVTYHFLNIPSDLICGKCCSFSRKTTIFVLFYISPDYCKFNNFWLTMTFDLLKLILKYQSILGACCEVSSETTW